MVIPFTALWSHNLLLLFTIVNTPSMLIKMFRDLLLQVDSKKVPEFRPRPLPYTS